MQGSSRVVWLVVLAACGGGTNYLDQPPAEAGAELADLACDISFECGVIEIDCDPPGATIVPAAEFYGTREACEAQLTDVYVELFTGCAAANLTEAQRDDLNDCLNSVSGHCSTDAELDDLVERVCSGGSGGTTEACQRASAVLTLCSQCANDPTDC